MQEDSGNDWEFQRMFWFAEGKTVIDKTWTSVARLANLRTNQGQIRAAMRETLVGYASKDIFTILTT